MRIGEIITRILWMFKVNDCRHICLFCEYYEMCREELAGMEETANEYEIRNEK